MNKEQRKAEAIELLKQLNIYEPYINGYKNEDKVCFFEQFGGYWIEQEPEIEKKMRELEEYHGITIYAATHEVTSFGECWSFLYVSKFKEEWPTHVTKVDKTGGFYVDAYVWNKSEEMFSEFGIIGIKTFGGGITRVE